MSEKAAATSAPFFRYSEHRLLRYRNKGLAGAGKLYGLHMLIRNGMMSPEASCVRAANEDSRLRLPDTTGRADTVTCLTAVGLHVMKYSTQYPQKFELEEQVRLDSHWVPFRCGFVDCLCFGCRIEDGEDLSDPAIQGVDSSKLMYLPSPLKLKRSEGFSCLWVPPECPVLIQTNPSALFLSAFLNTFATTFSSHSAPSAYKQNSAKRLKFPQRWAISRQSRSMASATTSTSRSKTSSARSVSTSPLRR